MESRFSIFKTVRGEATETGRFETAMGCNGDLHAAWDYEIFLEDPANPDSETLDSEEVGRRVVGPCDHTCAGPEQGWFLCEATKPKLVYIN